jgi:hypothetical protein
MNTKLNFRPVGMTLLVWIIAFGLLFLIGSLLPTKVQATTSQLPISDITAPITSTNSSIYLPLLFRNIDPAVPQLTSPQNGAGLGTLIPTFIWDTGTQPADTDGCLTFGTTSNPTGCRMSYSIDNSVSHEEIVMWYNLEPSTLYYWRVGVVYNSDYAHPKWSAEWSFTTGAAGGPILPAPILQSPANNSTITTPDVTLTWQPVAGAVEYSVTLHALDIDRWYGYDNATSTQQEINILNFVQSGNGNNYEWFVEARNDYAWSSSSEKWKFTYSTP